VTIDEELSRLEDDLRRLKVEYDIYFNGGSPRPPHDTVSRVEKTLKRYASGDAAKLSFSQRFRFQSLQQKYVLNKDVWQRKLRDKEEGRGRFTKEKVEVAVNNTEGPIRVVCSDPEKEKDKVEHLLQAMVQAKRQVGERVDNIDPEAFAKFVREKTRQIKESLGCEKVQFSVSVEEGKVKFKAVKGE
jgi:hypothetical protein